LRGVFVSTQWGKNGAKNWLYSVLGEKKPRIKRGFFIVVGKEPDSDDL